MTRPTLACAALAALALMTLSVTPAAAQLATGSNAPVDITADEGEVVNSQCLSIWRGDAEALQATTRLRAQVIRVFSAAKAGAGANSQSRCGATQRLEAEGNVYYVTPEQAVRGDRAIYLAETDTITITGGVVVTQGRSVARGDRMTVKVKTGQVNLESSVKGRGKPGRVRGVFYPTEADANSAAPAAR